MTDQNTNDPSNTDPTKRPKLSLRRAGSPDTAKAPPSRTEQKDTASAHPKAPIRMEFKKRVRREEKETPPETPEEDKPPLKLSGKTPSSARVQDSEKNQELNENAFSNVQGRDPGGASSHISPSSLSFLKRKKTPEPVKEESTEEHEDDGNSLPFVPQVKIPSPSKPTKPIFEKPSEEAPPPPPPVTKETFSSQPDNEDVAEEIDESLVEPPIDEIIPAKAEEPPTDRRPPPMIKPPAPKEATSEEEDSTTAKPLDKGLSRIPFRSKKPADPVKSMDDLDPELAEFVEPPAGSESPPKEQPPKPRTPPPPPISPSAPTTLKAPPPPGLKPPSSESSPPPPKATSAKKKPTVLAAPPPVSPDANTQAANPPPPPPPGKKSEKKSSIIGSLIAFILLFTFLAAGVYLIYRGITAGSKTTIPPTTQSESKVPPPEPLTPRKSNNVISKTRETLDQVEGRAVTTNNITADTPATPAPKTEVGTWEAPGSENLPLEIIPASREIAAQASNAPSTTPSLEPPTVQSTSSSDQVYPVQEVSDYVDALTINGAGPSEDNPRVIISGKIYQGGAQISENPAVFFVTVDKNSREVVFRDERGAIYRKPY